MVNTLCSMKKKCHSVSFARRKCAPWPFRRAFWWTTKKAWLTSHWLISSTMHLSMRNSMLTSSECQFATSKYIEELVSSIKSSISFKMLLSVLPFCKKSIKDPWQNKIRLCNNRHSKCKITNQMMRSNKKLISSLSCLSRQWWTESKLKKPISNC